MKARLYCRCLLGFGILFFLSTACAIPSAGQNPQNAASTQPVKTIGASTLSPNLPAATSTVTTPTTSLPQTPRPSTTTAILPSPSPVEITTCDQVGFVADINVPDGTVITAGAEFEKTWRLKNKGTCTWTRNYAVVFEDTHDPMNGPGEQRLGTDVPPGGTIDITLNLQAPGEPGSYHSNWKLRNAAGVLFGLGPDMDRPFYVDIKVVSAPASGAGYDFTENYCAAGWIGNTITLPCIGTDGNAKGFIRYVKNPILETGYVDNEPALLTNPPLTMDGVIHGEFPAFTVRPNDHFTAIIGCEHNAQKCNVRFQLDYQIDTGSIQNLGIWNEVYDNKYQNVDVDLSSLAGKNVMFILTVFANGASDQDRALWLQPRIINQPIYTSTPTKAGYPAP